MKEEYKQFISKAAADQEVIKKTFQKFRQKKPRDLDANFHSLHEKVFQKIDCLQCANCCKTTSPIFRDVDVKRISKMMKMREQQFVDQFLRRDEDGDLVLQQSPCYFLGEDNKCSIYEHRPLACREYPHTDRKNMYQILDLTQRNTLVCPAVAKVVEEIIF